MTVLVENLKKSIKMLQEQINEKILEQNKRKMLVALNEAKISQDTKSINQE